MSFEAQPHQGGRDPSLYRPNVGLALFSKQGHVWLGRRAGVRKDDVRYAWQMPQGGIDRGETPSQAALREEHEPWLFYDFPPALKAKLTGPYYGQRQKWFAYRFTGSDTDFRLDRHTVEFDAWKWAKLEDAPGLVIPFKAAVYAEIAKGFVRWTAPV